jgi:hypothetical protein
MHTLELSGYLIIATLFVSYFFLSLKFLSRSTHKFKYRYFMLLGLFVYGVICILLTAWPVIYSELWLNYLGAGMSQEPAAWLDSVAEKNKAEAMKLYHSNMGVGWPIPAVLLFIVIGIPLSIMTTLVAKWFSKRKSVVAKIT